MARTRLSTPSRPSRSRTLKLLGIASVVGVAASGAVAARAERQRRAYTPDQVRDRLRERHAETLDHGGPVEGAPD